MILWEREKQCENCWHECGYEEAEEICEDGTILYRHLYDCNLGNTCSTDLECPEFTEEER